MNLPVMWCGPSNRQTHSRDEPHCAICHRSPAGKHKVYVFPVDDEKPMHRMNTTGWNSATARAADRIEQETGKPAAWGFRNLRVHDLKHIFGRRLRASGVSLETRKVLLAHTTGDITTHYSAAELGELIEAVEKVSDNGTSCRR